MDGYRTNIGIFAILGELARASTDTQDEFTPQLAEGAFSQAVARAMESKRQQQELQLGEVLQNLINRVTDVKRAARDGIREARRVVTQNKRVLDNIDQAWNYANQTQNFVPLASQLGLKPSDVDLTYKEWQGLNTIPNDWAPPAPVRQSTGE